MLSIFRKFTRRKSPKSSKSPKSPKSSKSPKSPKSPKLSSLVENKLYPFWYNKIPFPEDPDDDLFEDTTWYKHLALALKMYGNKSSLPKGSILFHGSTLIDPINTIKPSTKSYFFFGLDAFISIWYISELAYKSNINYGYLNIYQTLQTIPYKYLPLPHGNTDHPDDNEACKNIACMHPELGYHIEVNESLPVELSIEFTIPINNISNKLKLIGVYAVDVLKLYDNKDKNFNEFKAIEALMLKTDFTK
jgi:hypothetical protein